MLEPVRDLAALVDTALKMTSKYSFMTYKLRFFGHFRLVSSTFAKIVNRFSKRLLSRHGFCEVSSFFGRGFTLIEMLVVMAIVALLLSIAVPRYFGSLDRSKEAALRQNLAVMRDVLDKFYTDQGHYPDTLDELVEKKYLRALPVDPLTESDKTWIAVPSQDQNIKGISDIRSGAEGSAADGVPFEQW